MPHFDFFSRHMGSGVYIEAIMLKNGLVVFPFMKMHQVVFAYDEDELMAGVLFREAGHGVYRIARLGQVKFHICRPEFVMIGRGQLYHPEPVKLM